MHPVIEPCLIRRNDEFGNNGLLAVDALIECRRHLADDVHINLEVAFGCGFHGLMKDCHRSPRSLILQSLAHCAVHVFHNLYTPSVFLLDYFRAGYSNHIVGELNDVNLVCKDCVFARPVTLKKDLLDEFFT
jgi:hypothetical protein